MPHIATIYRLGIKELWSLVRDPTMLGVIIYMFTLSMARRSRRALSLSSIRHVSTSR